ncbi:pentapeptide repeat-containing protein [Lentzea sp. BCCO 10_0061]|uniref:Pentapeptide repeat-containing protein n=1 Tax=Lentzea sokolovensis TaxID=3095429 RepID=A0ABU4V904_9PSEU|nr:pentapeptide repeat-containing protein [Lentzea sp. BCCO 10_0061]MDX8147350.1 pentapeptide repeat-containing protein [Lentzea sp. BCCO 10_0061]
MSDDRPRYRVLSQRSITIAGVLLVLVGVGLAMLLVWAYGGGTDAERNKLDAIRTAGTIVVGAGGAGALWLAARRQRTTEISLKQKEHDQSQADRTHELNELTATNNRADAVERLVTELYGKAVEQLGSDKAAVRMGGMFALERLAQNIEDQRQTIVNVLCAYLRMRPPDDELEAQVRTTAQTILTKHLRPETGRYFWADTDLDLSGARLAELDLGGCRARHAVFRGCQLQGRTTFRQAAFTDISFDDALIDDDVWFDELAVDGESSWRGARFAGAATFDGAVLRGRARFDRVDCAGQAVFVGVEFGGDVSFDGAVFHRESRFQRAVFRRMASFDGVGFAQQARFTGACFAGEVAFDGTRFTEVRFDEVMARTDVPADTTRTWPPGFALNGDCPAPPGCEGTWGTVVSGKRAAP